MNLRNFAPGLAALYLAAMVAVGVGPALAADDMVVKDGSGASVTLATKDDGSREHPKHIAEGMDGSTPTPITVDSSGRPTVNVNGTLTVGTHAVTQSGTWTVQPGNTANTTAWKVDGSSVTQPVSASSLPLPTGAATAAKQPALGTAGAASTDVITVQGIASGVAQNVTCTSGCSGGAQFAEDLAATNADLGTQTLTVRKDSVAATSGTDGDYQPLTTDASGRLWVNCSTGCAGGTQFAEDAASANGDVGTIGMAVRKATPANTSGTDGDYEALQISAGRLWTSATIDAALPAGSNAIGTVTAVGNVAAGATDSGNPVKTGGVYNATLPTLTTGQRGDLQLDPNANLRVRIAATAGAIADGAANNAAFAANTASASSILPLSVMPYVFNGTTWDRPRSAIAAQNSDGTGITAAGILAQYDDVSPSSVTENQFAPLRMTSDRALMVSAVGAAATASTDVTRPADTTAYAANDALSDSTSAPTTGGFTISNACRMSGGAGVLTALTIISSNDPATLLQGEIWLFDSAVTAVNDNAAFALSDSDAKKLVGVVPFTLASTTGGSGTNSYAHVSGLSLGYACSGSANLRYLVKVKSAYTPASAEVITARANVVYAN